MGIQPVLRDDNGCALLDYGSELFTRRYSGVGADGQAMSLGVDVKRVVIHIEGSTVRARFLGTVQGSESINWTSDGLTLPELSLVKEADQRVLTVAAPSGTINVSIMAWR
jgi:hypothetical protein